MRSPHGYSRIQGVRGGSSEPGGVKMRVGAVMGDDDSVGIHSILSSNLGHAQSSEQII